MVFEIEVLNKTCTVCIVNRGKTNWHATGNFGDIPIVAVSYVSEIDALTKWRENATNEVKWS
jgi:hypothetical protein